MFVPTLACISSDNVQHGWMITAPKCHLRAHFLREQFLVQEAPQEEVAGINTGAVR